MVGLRKMNLVRATYQPGEIIVKVSSPGLKTGTIRITSTRSEPQKEPFFEQPMLMDEGRNKVKRMEDFKEKIDYEAIISTISANRNFNKDKENNYREQINKFLLVKNQNAKNYPKAYQLFTAKLNANLIKMKGTRIADDFNFMAEQFNNEFTFENEKLLIIPSPDVNDFLEELKTQK